MVEFVGDNFFGHCTAFNKITSLFSMMRDAPETTQDSRSSCDAACSMNCQPTYELALYFPSDLMVNEAQSRRRSGSWRRRAC